MDPLAFTSFLLTALAAWRQETGSTEISEFILYIKQEALPAFEKQLTNNHEIVEATNKLLLQDTHEIKQRIDELNRVMLDIAARSNLFSGLVHVSGYRPELSEQAISILQQFVDSGASELWEFRNSDSAMPTSRYILIGVHKDLRIDDSQFVDDDFAKLIEMEFLRDNGTDSRGNKKFRITRQAQQFIEGINEQHLTLK